MKLSSERLFNEKLFAGLRSLGVGIALAGFLAVFFSKTPATAVVVLMAGLVILFAASYTKPTGGDDV